VKFGINKVCGKEAAIIHLPKCVDINYIALELEST